MSEGYEAEYAKAQQARLRQEVQGTMFDAVAPPARVEQAVLPIPDATIQGRWEAWLATEDGARAFGVFCEMACNDAVAGDRLSAKALWERMRATMRVRANNSFTALAAREAEERHPVLRGRFEKRERHAA